MNTSNTSVERDTQDPTPRLVQYRIVDEGTAEIYEQVATQEFIHAAKVERIEEIDPDTDAEELREAIQNGKVVLRITADEPRLANTIPYRIKEDERALKYFGDFVKWRKMQQEKTALGRLGVRLFFRP